MASNPRIISIRGKGLKLDTRSDIEPFLNVDPATVEEIHLSGNTIGVDASEALAKFLQGATSLKIANFADIFTGRLISEIPLALTAICNALIDKTSLIEINLNDNAFGGRSVEPMIPFFTHNRSFQILKLNNNGLGPVGGTAIANALLESANISKKEGKPSNLRTVICGRNRLENGSAPVWAEAFAAHGTLEEVCMPQNGIRMEGITALAKGLSKCKDLKHIDLQDNTFIEDGSTTGVQAWSDALPSWPELNTLNLSDCVLSEDGEVPLVVKALAAGSNPTLHSLELQNNNLDAKTFELLASAISTHMDSLKTLALQWNEIDEDEGSLTTLRDALKIRGGKLFVSDEDEEEEEEEREVEGEGEEEEEMEKKEEARTPAKQRLDKDADELADLLARTSI